MSSMTTSNEILDTISGGIIYEEHELIMIMGKLITRPHLENGNQA